MSKLDAPSNNPDPSPLEVRTGTAQLLRDRFEEWTAANPAQAAHPEIQQIWDDIMTAEVPSEDTEADEALKRAGTAMETRKMLGDETLDSLTQTAIRELKF